MSIISSIKKYKNFSTQGIRYFLESGYFPSEFSVNENIKKLKAGQLLEFDEKRVKDSELLELKHH